jgi:hypothetical protein
LLSLSSRRGGSAEGGSGGSSFDDLTQTVNNTVDEVGKFADWVANHATEQISQNQGWRGTAWDFFATDGINAYHQLNGGDYYAPYTVIVVIGYPSPYFYYL